MSGWASLWGIFTIFGSAFSLIHILLAVMASVAHSLLPICRGNIFGEPMFWESELNVRQDRLRGHVGSETDLGTPGFISMVVADRFLID
jgi:hypothetical protein